ncbi:MAG: aspartate dehydrogenase [Sphingomonadales bacterium]|nr:aspartate dehydrogenase [Sphingomonadales bacterium]
MADVQPLRVGIAGLGAIGTEVARALDAGIPGLVLEAVSVRDIEKAETTLGSFRSKPNIVSLNALADCVDLVVESAPPAIFDQVARPAVEAGRILIVMSSGALLTRPDLIERARETGARIIVPSGGILGLDGLKAAAEGEIQSVTLITRKPPASLAGAPCLTENGIEPTDIDAPLRVFAGNALEAAAVFPANVNVAASLSLAGIGPELTRVEIWADPGLETLRQEVRIASDAADISLRLTSYPLRHNPRTGSLTPKSAIATLRGLIAVLQAGT